MKVPYELIVCIEGFMGGHNLELVRVPLQVSLAAEVVQAMLSVGVYSAKPGCLPSSTGSVRRDPYKDEG